MKLAERVSAVQAVAEKASVAQSIAEKAFGPINRIAEIQESLGGVASIAKMHQTNEFFKDSSAMGKTNLSIIIHKILLD